MTDTDDVFETEPLPNSEHYDLAAKMLSEVDANYGTEYGSTYVRGKVAAAQVHALLALRDVMLESL